ncbi:MAG: amidohydrolase family protein, partial [SAR202 cluster bacterium]|nr:amidohydrolase family protein [SAR202 cluster bacterium]
MPKAKPSTPFTLVKAARLIDGKADRPIANGAVLVQGTRIVAAGPASRVKAPDGAKVDVLDYSGKTLMPGMV